MSYSYLTTWTTKIVKMIEIIEIMFWWQTRGYREVKSLSKFLSCVHLEGILSVMETSYWYDSQFLLVFKVFPVTKFICIVSYSG